MPKPRDCVDNSVPAALTAATYFTTAVLCDGRAVEILKAKQIGKLAICNYHPISSHIVSWFSGTLDPR